MLVEGLAGSIVDNGGQAVKAAEGMSKDINGVMQDLAKDMTTALPTDFSVKGSMENAMASAVSGGAGKSGFVLQLNIGTFNNYTNEDIRQLTNEIMVTAGQFAKRKGVVFALTILCITGFRPWTWGFALRARMCFLPRSTM